MSNAIIREAFESRLNTWATNRSSPLAISWENIAKDLTDEFYVESYMFPSENTNDFLEGNHIRFVGFFQFSVVGQKGYGVGAIELIAQEICNLFPCSAGITQSGLDIEVTNPPSIGRAIPSERKFTVPVTVYYRCEVVN